jgi:predicted metalloprotease
LNLFDCAGWCCVSRKWAGKDVRDENLLGILARVARLQEQASSKVESKALQVKVELQPDCLAGPHSGKIG